MNLHSWHLINGFREKPANVTNPVKLETVNNSGPSPVLSDKAIFTSSALAYSKGQSQRFVLYLLAVPTTLCEEVCQLFTYMKCVFATLDFC
jgi:hypothetical protein